MKKVFFALCVAVAFAGTAFSQNNNSAEQASEKAVCPMQKECAAACPNQDCPKTECTPAQCPADCQKADCPKAQCKQQTCPNGKPGKCAKKFNCKKGQGKRGNGKIAKMYRHGDRELTSNRKGLNAMAGINLSAEQKAQLKSLRDKRSKEMKKVRESSDKDRAKVAENYKKDLKKILTPEQYAQYEKNMTSMPVPHPLKVSKR